MVTKQDMGQIRSLFAGEVNVTVGERCRRIICIRLLSLIWIRLSGGV